MIVSLQEEKNDFFLSPVSKLNEIELSNSST